MAKKKTKKKNIWLVPSAIAMASVMVLIGLAFVYVLIVGGFKTRYEALVSFSFKTNMGEGKDAYIQLGEEYATNKYYIFYKTKDAAGNLDKNYSVRTAYNNHVLVAENDKSYWLNATGEEPIKENYEVGNSLYFKDVISELITKHYTAKDEFLVEDFNENVLIYRVYNINILPEPYDATELDFDLTITSQNESQATNEAAFALYEARTNEEGQEIKDKKGYPLYESVPYTIYNQKQVNAQKPIELLLRQTYISENEVLPQQYYISKLYNILKDKVDFADKNGVWSVERVEGDKSFDFTAFDDILKDNTKDDYNNLEYYKKLSETYVNLKTNVATLSDYIYKAAVEIFNLTFRETDPICEDNKAVLEKNVHLVNKAGQFLLKAKTSSNETAISGAEKYSENSVVCKIDTKIFEANIITKNINEDEIYVNSSFNVELTDFVPENSNKPYNIESKKVRYFSSNSKVASVNENGEVLVKQQSDFTIFAYVASLYEYEKLLENQNISTFGDLLYNLEGKIVWAQKDYSVREVKVSSITSTKNIEVGIDNQISFSLSDFLHINPDANAQTGYDPAYTYPGMLQKLELVKNKVYIYNNVTEKLEECSSDYIDVKCEFVQKELYKDVVVTVKALNEFSTTNKQLVIEWSLENAEGDIFKDTTFVTIKSVVAYEVYGSLLGQTHKIKYQKGIDEPLWKAYYNGEYVVGERGIDVHDYLQASLVDFNEILEEGNFIKFAEMSNYKNVKFFVKSGQKSFLTTQKRYLINNQYYEEIAGFELIADGLDYIVGLKEGVLYPIAAGGNVEIYPMLVRYETVNGVERPIYVDINQERLYFYEDKFYVKYQDGSLENKEDYEYFCDIYTGDVYKLDIAGQTLYQDDSGEKLILLNNALYEEYLGKVYKGSDNKFYTDNGKELYVHEKDGKKYLYKQRSNYLNAAKQQIDIYIDKSAKAFKYSENSDTLKIEQPNPNNIYQNLYYLDDDDKIQLYEPGAAVYKFVDGAIEGEETTIFEYATGVEYKDGTGTNLFMLFAQTNKLYYFDKDSLNALVEHNGAVYNGAGAEVAANNIKFGETYYTSADVDTRKVITSLNANYKVDGEVLFKINNDFTYRIEQNERNTQISSFDLGLTYYTNQNKEAAYVWKDASGEKYYYQMFEEVVSGGDYGAKYEKIYYLEGNTTHYYNIEDEKFTQKNEDSPINLSGKSSGYYKLTIIGSQVTAEQLQNISSQDVVVCVVIKTYYEVAAANISENVETYTIDTTKTLIKVGSEYFKANEDGTVSETQVTPTPTLLKTINVVRYSKVAQLQTGNQYKEDALGNIYEDRRGLLEVSSNGNYYYDGSNLVKFEPKSQQAYYLRTISEVETAGSGNLRLINAYEANEFTTYFTEEGNRLSYTKIEDAAGKEINLFAQKSDDSAKIYAESLYNGELYQKYEGPVYKDENSQTYYDNNGKIVYYSNGEYYNYSGLYAQLNLSAQEVTGVNIETKTTPTLVYKYKQPSTTKLYSDITCAAELDDEKELTNGNIYYIDAGDDGVKEIYFFNGKIYYAQYVLDDSNSYNNNLTYYVDELGAQATKLIKVDRSGYYKFTVDGGTITSTRVAGEITDSTNGNISYAEVVITNGKYSRASTTKLYQNDSCDTELADETPLNIKESYYIKNATPLIKSNTKFIYRESDGSYSEVDGISINASNKIQIGAGKKLYKGNGLESVTNGADYVFGERYYLVEGKAVCYNSYLEAGEYYAAVVTEGAVEKVYSDYFIKNGKYLQGWENNNFTDTYIEKTGDLVQIKYSAQAESYYYSTPVSKPAFVNVKNVKDVYLFENNTYTLVEDETYIYDLRDKYKGITATEAEKLDAGFYYVKSTENTADFDDEKNVVIKEYAIEPVNINNIYVNDNTANKLTAVGDDDGDGVVVGLVISEGKYKNTSTTKLYSDSNCTIELGDNAVLTNGDTYYIDTVDGTKAVWYLNNAVYVQYEQGKCYYIDENGTDPDGVKEVYFRTPGYYAVANLRPTIDYHLVKDNEAAADMGTYKLHNLVQGIYSYTGHDFLRINGVEIEETAGKYKQSSITKLYKYEAPNYTELENEAVLAVGTEYYINLSDNYIKVYFAKGGEYFFNETIKEINTDEDEVLVRLSLNLKMVEETGNYYVELDENSEFKEIVKTDKKVGEFVETCPVVKLEKNKVYVVYNYKNKEGKIAAECVEFDDFSNVVTYHNENGKFLQYVNGKFSPETDSVFIETDVYNDGHEEQVVGGIVYNLNAQIYYEILPETSDAICEYVSEYTISTNTLVCKNGEFYKLNANGTLGEKEIDAATKKLKTIIVGDFADVYYNSSAQVYYEEVEVAENYTEYLKGYVIDENKTLIKEGEKYYKVKADGSRGDEHTLDPAKKIRTIYYYVPTSNEVYLGSDGLFYLDKALTQKYYGSVNMAAFKQETNYTKVLNYNDIFYLTKGTGTNYYVIENNKPRALKQNEDYLDVGKYKIKEDGSYESVGSGEDFEIPTVGVYEWTSKQGGGYEKKDKPFVRITEDGYYTIEAEGTPPTITYTAVKDYTIKFFIADSKNVVINREYNVFYEIIDSGTENEVVYNENYGVSPGTTLVKNDKKYYKINADGTLGEEVSVEGKLIRTIFVNVGENWLYATKNYYFINESLEFEGSEIKLGYSVLEQIDTSKVNKYMSSAKNTGYGDNIPNPVNINVNTPIYFRLTNGNANAANLINEYNLDELINNGLVEILFTDFAENEISADNYVLNIDEQTLELSVGNVGNYYLTIKISPDLNTKNTAEFINLLTVTFNVGNIELSSFEVTVENVANIGVLEANENKVVYYQKNSGDDYLQMKVIHDGVEKTAYYLESGNYIINAHLEPEPNLSGTVAISVNGYYIIEDFDIATNINTLDVLQTLKLKVESTPAGFLNNKPITLSVSDSSVLQLTDVSGNTQSEYLVDANGYVTVYYKVLKVGAQKDIVFTATYGGKTAANEEDTREITVDNFISTLYEKYDETALADPTKTLAAFRNNTQIAAHKYVYEFNIADTKTISLCAKGKDIHFDKLNLAIQNIELYSINGNVLENSNLKLEEGDITITKDGSVFILDIDPGKAYMFNTQYMVIKLKPSTNFGYDWGSDLIEVKITNDVTPHYYLDSETYYGVDADHLKSFEIVEYKGNSTPAGAKIIWNEDFEVIGTISVYGTYYYTTTDLLNLTRECEFSVVDGLLREKQKGKFSAAGTYYYITSDMSVAVINDEGNWELGGDSSTPERLFIKENGYYVEAGEQVIKYLNGYNLGISDSVLSKDLAYGAFNTYSITANGSIGYIQAIFNKNETLTSTVIDSSKLAEGYVVVKDGANILCKIKITTEKYEALTLEQVFKESVMLTKQTEILAEETIMNLEKYVSETLHSSFGGVDHTSTYNFKFYDEVLPDGYYIQTIGDEQYLYFNYTDSSEGSETYGQNVVILVAKIFELNGKHYVATYNLTNTPYLRNDPLTFNIEYTVSDVEIETTPDETNLNDLDISLVLRMAVVKNASGYGGNIINDDLLEFNENLTSVYLKLYYDGTSYYKPYDIPQGTKIYTDDVCTTEAPATLTDGTYYVKDESNNVVTLKYFAIGSVFVIPNEYTIALGTTIYEKTDGFDVITPADDGYYYILVDEFSIDFKVGVTYNDSNAFNNLMHDDISALLENEDVYVFDGNTFTEITPTPSDVGKTFYVDFEISKVIYEGGKFKDEFGNEIDILDKDIDLFKASQITKVDEITEEEFICNKYDLAIEKISTANKNSINSGVYYYKNKAFKYNHINSAGNIILKIGTNVIEFSQN